MNKAKIETLYLSYLNDYLTIPVFAEAHGMSEAKALRLIRIGRRLNDRRFSKHERPPIKGDVDEHYINALNLISRRIFDAGKTLESIDRSLQKIAEPDAIITFPEDR